MMIKPTHKLVLSALFLAAGIILPFFTGQIPQIGNLLLPMHFVVFLCTYICGWKYGTIIGFTLPLLRCFLFGMPFLYPDAIAMSFELCAYGFVAGIIYQAVKRRNVIAVYSSMIAAMLCGRAVWGVAKLLLLGIKSEVFTWEMFIAAAFINAVPGILIQLILIPAIVSIHNWKFQKAEQR